MVFRTFIPLLLCALFVSLPAGNGLGEETEEVVKILSVPYAEIPSGTDQNLLSLDIYHTRAARNQPVMVYIHGGGWRTGDKSAVALKPEFFAGRGFVFVSINYRLVPQVDITTQLQDSANAIAWVHENIGAYGGDGSKIHLIGHSAGAHHVATLATNEQFLNKAGVPLDVLQSVIELDTGTLNVPLRMRSPPSDIFPAAFGDNPDIWETVSPNHHVEAGKAIPPFFLVVANNRPAKLAQARAFQDKLKESGVTCSLVEAPEHTHASLNRSLGNPEDKVTKLVKEFLTRITGPESEPVASGS